MDGFGDDVHYVHSFCHLERRDWHRSQFDYIASTCCPAVVKNTDDGACESCHLS